MDQSIYFDYHDKFTIGIVQLHSLRLLRRCQLCAQRRHSFSQRFFHLPLQNGAAQEPEPTQPCPQEPKQAQPRTQEPKQAQPAAPQTYGRLL